MKEVKLGCIGCGGNGRGHMNALLKLEGVRIAAVCDLLEDRAQEAAEVTGGTAYTDLHKMLESEDLDAAYISIPMHNHGEPELAVIERGLPFLVEKPVARTMETAQEIQKAVEKSGLMTCVGYQLRYCGSTDIARDVLSDQKITMAVGKYWSGSGRGDTSRWTRHFAKSGGQLGEQATHTIDMMRFLVGEVVEVTARSASRQLDEIDCPDANVVTFEFDNGALGSLTTSWSFDPADWSHANILNILYDQSFLAWDGARVVIRSGGQDEERTAPGPGIDEVFVDAVRRGDGSGIRSSYSDAVKSLAVSLAALESAEKGTAVRVS